MTVIWQYEVCEQNTTLGHYFIEFLEKVATFTGALIQMGLWVMLWPNREN